MNEETKIEEKRRKVLRGQALLDMLNGWQQEITYSDVKPEAIAEREGFSAGYVRAVLRILKLPATALEKVKTENLSQQVATELCGVKDEKLLDKILKEKDLTVYRVRDLKRAKPKKDKAKKPQKAEP